MVAINDITDGIEARLATISELHPASEWKENVETPGALIFPPAISQTSFDGQYDMVFRVLVFTNIAQGYSKAARQLNSYMDTTGSTSIRAALAGDITLGGLSGVNVDVAAMRWSADRAGFVSMGGIDYWGAYIENLMVYACD